MKRSLTKDTWRAERVSYPQRVHGRLVLGTQEFPDIWMHFWAAQEDHQRQWWSHQLWGIKVHLSKVPDALPCNGFWQLRDLVDIVSNPQCNDIKPQNGAIVRGDFHDHFLLDHRSVLVRSLQRS